MSFSLSAVMCARGLAHSHPTRMQLYALKGLYIVAKLFFQCSHVVQFVLCFCGLTYTIFSTTLRTRALRDRKKQFLSQDKSRYNWNSTECHF